MGNKDLPLVFVGDEAQPTIADSTPSQDTTPAPDLTSAPPTTGETTATPPETNPTSFSAANALNDIKNAASPAIFVQLKLASDKLKIHTDPLNFSITTNKGGHLTVLQVGSDGKTFNRLFPNDKDQDDFINPGVTILPRPSWQIKAGGPAGTSYLLAIISDAPKDFSKGMKVAGPFRTSSGSKGAKNLYIEATQSNEGPKGIYGASEVIPVQEY